MVDLSSVSRHGPSERPQPFLRYCSLVVDISTSGTAYLSAPFDEM
jgi:hypothetical protein